MPQISTKGGAVRSNLRGCCLAVVTATSTKEWIHSRSTIIEMVNSHCPDTRVLPIIRMTVTETSGETERPGGSCVEARASRKLRFPVCFVALWATSHGGRRGETERLSQIRMYVHIEDRLKDCRVDTMTVSFIACIIVTIMSAGHAVVLCLTPRTRPPGPAARRHGRTA